MNPSTPSLDSLIQNAGRQYGAILSHGPAPSSGFNVSPGTPPAPAPTSQTASDTELVQDADSASAAQYGAWAPSSANDNGVTAGLKAAANVIPSAGHLAGGVLSMFMHPIQTVTGLGNAAGGALKEGSNAVFGTKFSDNSTQTWDSLKSAFVTRYGSLDNLRRTATNDPVGFGADVATILSGAGAAADVALGGADAANAVRGATEMAQTGAFGDAAKAGTVGADIGKGGLYSNAIKDVGQKVADVATKPLDAVGAGIKKAGGMLNLSASTDKGLMDTAAKYDVTLPASAVNSNPLVKQVEALAAKGFGGEKFTARVENAQEAMQTAAGKLSGTLDGSTDLTSLGKKVASGMQDYHSAFDETKNAIYDQFASEGGKTVPAVTTNTEQALSDILAEKGQSLGSGNDSGYFQNMLDKIQGDTEEEGAAKAGELPTISAEGNQGPQFQYENLNQTRKEIGAKLANKLGDPVVSQNTAAYSKLYNALSQDMDATLKAGGRDDLLELKNTASEVYKAGIEQLNSKYGSTIKKFADAGQYSKIVPALLNPTTAVEDIPKIFSLVGDEAKPDVQRAVLDGIFTKAKGSDGSFTPSGIARQIKLYTPDRLQKILTPEQYTTLTDLDKLSQAMGEASKLTKGSQTAFLGRVIAETTFGSSAISSLATGDFTGFFAKLSPIIGDYAMGKFVNSDFGQKLLTLGLDGSPKLKGAIGAVKTAGSTTAKAGTRLYPLSRTKELTEGPQQ